MYWGSVRHPRGVRFHAVVETNVYAPAVPGVVSSAG